MLDKSEIAFLATETGAALLCEAESDAGDLHARIARLRRSYSREHVSAALTMLDLRRRAKDKFTRANEMYFTPEGYEQSTGETIARWRADRFPAGAHILDLCCGIGGDAVQLARRGQVTAVDLSPESALCATLNAQAYGTKQSLSVECADVTQLDLRADAVFFDPSRRQRGRRVKSAEQYSPPL